MIAGTGPDGRPRWGGGAAGRAAGLCGEQGAGWWRGRGAEIKLAWQQQANGSALHQGAVEVERGAGPRARGNCRATVPAADGRRGVGPAPATGGRK